MAGHRRQRAGGRSHVSAISVSPTHGVGATTDTSIDVTGVGFKTSTYDFSGSGHSVVVFNETGAYVDAETPAGTCSGVHVVSDTELVCTMDHTLTDGAYTVIVVADTTAGSTNADNPTSVTSSATFTVAAF